MKCFPNLLQKAVTPVEKIIGGTSKCMYEVSLLNAEFTAYTGLIVAGSAVATGNLYNAIVFAEHVYPLTFAVPFIAGYRVLRALNDDNICILGGRSK